MHKSCRKNFQVSVLTNISRLCASVPLIRDLDDVPPALFPAISARQDSALVDDRQISITQLRCTQHIDRAARCGVLSAFSLDESMISVPPVAATVQVEGRDDFGGFIRPIRRLNSVPYLPSPPPVDWLNLHAHKPVNEYSLRPIMTNCSNKEKRS